MKAIIKYNLMNRKIVCLLLIVTVFLLNACQKNSDVFVPDAGQLNGPDTSWYSTITPDMPVSAVKNDLLLSSYFDSIQVNNNPAYITTPFGMQCIFPPHCCVGSFGQTITGNVKVEVILIKKKGDMIRMNKPTTSNNRLLVNGGDIFIRLKKDSNEVQLGPNIKIQIRYSDAPISTQMRFFGGDESNSERFNWLPDTNSSNNNVSPNPQGYEITTNHLHWVSSEYFYDTTGISRVSLAADLAAYFTNANTIAFTVFNDFRSVIAMYGDISSRKFSTPRLPVGKAVTVVVISKQGNDYFMGYQNTVTAMPVAGGSTQAVTVKPIKRSLSDILYFLNSL